MCTPLSNSLACAIQLTWHTGFGKSSSVQCHLGALTWFWIWICCSPCSLESCLTLNNPCQAWLLSQQNKPLLGPHMPTCAWVEQRLEESPPKMLFGWYWVCWRIWPLAFYLANYFRSNYLRILICFLWVSTAKLMQNYFDKFWVFCRVNLFLGHQHQNCQANSEVISSKNSERYAWVLI